jgi:Flp pilus assembly protein TadD
MVYAQAPQPRIEQQSLQQSYNQGVKKLAQGNFNGAVKDFDQVVQLNPRYAEAYCLRALAKAQLGNFPDAVSDYNQSLKLNPRHTDAYNGRGMINAELGDTNVSAQKIGV